MRIQAISSGMQNGGSFGGRRNRADTKNMGLFFAEVLNTFNADDKAKGFAKHIDLKV